MAMPGLVLVLQDQTWSSGGLSESSKSGFLPCRRSQMPYSGPMSTNQSDEPAESGRSVRTAMRSAARVVVARPEDRMPLDQAEHALFLDSGDRAYKYQRFGLLLVLSSVIATGGIVLNSTATVVGAMIVAPLGVPIMGVALAPM